ncbi:glycoside hydrolase family 6 protein [Paenibacillus phocaensis]|uniref:glycoside hydrolase family 6 protein n=1 Tax=Paenibacillus phocaensis TaxID=1776378 RepID=UPI000839BDD0|nr:glycoside hydrolase family 6 protein [Paenibacillus phocaensis]
MFSKLFKRTTAMIAVAALALTLLQPIGVQKSYAAEAHVDNPFLGATMYVNPDYAALIDTSIAQVSDNTLKAKMQTVKSYPTAVWLDRMAAIAGGEANGGRKSLAETMDEVLAQKQGSTPIVATFVIYNLPGRDCHALASNGELPLTAEGLQTYKTSYIDPIVEVFSDPKYADIRIVAVIEPDSLPNLVTNLGDPKCAQANSTNIYRDATRYALEKLHAIPNVYNYMDIGHSGWLGWDSNRQPAIDFFTSVVAGTPAGLASVDGFITNTANTTPLEEPYLPDPNLAINGMQLKSAKYYEWNPYFDEADFTAALYSGFVAKGWPSSIGFLIDTSRNGWGGPNRPTGASGTTVDAYADSGRIDKRLHRGNWCNASGAGMGQPPQAAPTGYPGSHLDAFVWVKPPGESDGSSTDIPNNEGKGFDRMCDPTYTNADGTLTGALPGAPISGHWFHDQFVQLVQNAYPAIPTGGGETPTVPAAPAGLTATAGNSQVTLSWTASSGATSYNVKRATTSGGPYTTVATGVAAASYTDTGLTNGTTYYYVVSAANGAGESANSAEVAATPSGGGTGSGNLVLQYRTGDTNASDNQLKPQFNIKNNGTTAVDLSTLKIRYYFTKDGSQDVNAWIDWAQLGAANIQHTFGAVSGENADTYIELSFTAAAGQLAAGGQSGDIQLRMAKTDWSNFDESNDYSYDAAKTAYADWDHITLYQNDTLVWGIEPQ